ncbi:MAG TPA: hypothetical protein VGI96_09680 [Streptosporangiaceae bacterium]
MSAGEPASGRGRPKHALVSGNLFLIVTLVLVGLKLGGVVAWSWWVVLAPLWAPVVTILVIALPVAGMVLASRIGDRREDRRQRRLDRPPRWIGSRL